MTVLAARPSRPVDVPQPARVLARVVETDDVVTLRVAPTRGPIDGFAPAQFSMIGVVGLGDAVSRVGADRDGHLAE
ncbi:MAG: hypothetical protein AAFP84_05010, partial [Actinomycetota bacterium]